MAAECAQISGSYRRPALIAFSFLLILLICYLGAILGSRFQYQKARAFLRNDDVESSAQHLHRAQESLPVFSFPNDRKRLHILEGDIALQQAESTKSLSVMIDHLESADKAYSDAIVIQPLDVLAYTGLARTREPLERLYPFVKKVELDRPVIPVFEQLASLMPTNMFSITLQTKYFYSRNLQNQLDEVVAQSITMFPSLYYQLIRQPFYSRSMDEMIKASLLAAVDDSARPEAAYSALSVVFEKEGDIEKALHYYHQVISATENRIHKNHYLRLGKLYIRAKNYDEANLTFSKSLSGRNIDKTLDQIYRSYSSQKLYKEFLAFSKQKMGTNNTEYIELLIAQALIALEEYEFARSHLIRIKNRKYLAESFYLQARIAEKNKDWDTMELKSQRATVLKPGESKYYSIFSQALQRQGKLPQAEGALDLAIEKSNGSKQWLYNQRAWLRWSRHNYDGARDDWNSAISISPDVAGFYYNVARVYEKGENYPEAIRYAQKASSLDGKKAEYKKMLTALREKIK